MGVVLKLDRAVTLTVNQMHIGACLTDVEISCFEFALFWPFGLGFKGGWGMYSVYRQLYH